ncbi:MAG TPA: Nif3-like dinuclear metal center hexameric protein [Gemmatimonadales bacterium]|nr:Nif3-like dinuclear metal center hexameric protein [Gemmatimonadales bacterium]
MTLELARLVAYLDDYLRTGAIRDAPGALNGLQVANTGTVSRLAAAVDFCEATVNLAARAGADLLVVHHGLFWGEVRPLTGPHYRRVAALLRHDIALYAAHLPLDCHPEVGNNPLLARQLGLAPAGEFGEYEGQSIGVWCETDLDREALTRRLSDVLGTPPRLLAFGPERVRRVGIVSGAGGGLIPQAAHAGLDTFVTGEGAHHSYFDAEELGLNVYFGGHYRTETFGVRALAERLEAQFGLPWVFLDHPTGL